MKQFLNLLLFAIMLGSFANGYSKCIGGKWPVDSSFNKLLVNTGYTAPAFHFGFQLGLEIPIKRTYKTYTPLRFLKKLGFEKLPKDRTIYRQTTIEPFLMFYNHQFNHTNLSMGASWHYRIIGQTRFYSSFGLEAGRAFQFYRDAVVFDERGNPSERFLTSNGYYLLGSLIELGFIFNKKKHHSIYYRAHAGTLFPYNHALNAYLRNELGLRLISLR